MWNCHIKTILAVLAHATLSTAKVRLSAVVDTTCSDCQDWITTQLKPLWEDSRKRAKIKENYDLQTVATSVTRHKQGPALNSVLNCAHHELEQDTFFSFLFCWESSVEAWVRIAGSDEFEENVVDIDGVLTKCMPNQQQGQFVPSSNFSLMKKRTLADDVKGCTADKAKLAEIEKDLTKYLPAKMEEVPLITVGNHSYAMHDNDKCVYHLETCLDLEPHVSSASALQQMQKHSSFLALNVR